MIAEEINYLLSKPSTLESSGNIASNYWLIQMPNNLSKNGIRNLLNDTPLRYDSMSFAFTINTGDPIVRPVIHGIFIKSFS